MRHSEKPHRAEVPIDYVIYGQALSNNGSRETWGFIAEDLAAIDAHFIDYSTLANREPSTPPDTFSRRQGDAGTIAKIADFADSFTTKELTFTRASGDEITTKQVNTRELCVSDDTGAATCITKSQLDAFLENTGQNAAGTPAAPASPTQLNPPAEASPATTDATSTPEVESPSIIPDTTTTMDAGTGDAASATDTAPAAQ